MNANDVSRTGTKTIMDCAICAAITADAEKIRSASKGSAYSDLLTAELWIVLGCACSAKGSISSPMGSASTN